MYNEKDIVLWTEMQWVRHTKVTAAKQNKKSGKEA